MNNTFDIGRFGLLLKRQWQEFGKIFLISLVVLAGILVTFYAFNVPHPTERFSIDSLGLTFRFPLFFILGFLFITVVASTYFSTMGQKPRAIIELMIPCSVFEKYLAGIAFTSVISVLSFLLIFELVDVFYLMYLNNIFSDITVMNWNNVKVPMHFLPFSDNYVGIQNNNIIVRAFTLIPLTVTSLFLLGSIYFNRFHYIKTVVSVMIYSFIVGFLLVKLNEYLSKGKMYVNPDGNLNDPSTMAMWMLLLCGGLALVFWFIGYRRLKEKEV